MQKLRLFIIESLNPLDLLEGRSEGAALAKICEIFGHEVVLFQAKSRRDLNNYCDYISSIDRRGSNKSPICIHIAAHGDPGGLQFGRDYITWDKLFVSLEPLIKNMNDYRREVLISISACGAGRQELAAIIQSEIRTSRRYRNDFYPPEYIFATQGSGALDVTMWDDSAVSWTLFYHRIAKIEKRIFEADIGRIIDDIELSTNTVLRSFRWNNRIRRCEQY